MCQLLPDVTVSRFHYKFYFVTALLLFAFYLFVCICARLQILITNSLGYRMCKTETIGH